MDAYEKHRPAAEASPDAIYSGTVVATTTDFLVLGNGRRIYHPDDLAPLVAADSATAKSGQRSAAAWTRQRAWRWIGWGLVGGGAGLGFASLMETSDRNNGGNSPSTAFLLAGAAACVGGIAALGVASFGYAPVAEDERVSAFTTYDKDLRSRLDICVEGTRIIACEDAPPRVAPSAGPTPAPGLSPSFPGR